LNTHPPKPAIARADRYGIGSLLVPEKDSVRRLFFAGWPGDSSSRGKILLDELTAAGRSLEATAPYFSLRFYKNRPPEPLWIPGAECFWLRGFSSSEHAEAQAGGLAIEVGEGGCGGIREGVRAIVAKARAVAHREAVGGLRHGESAGGLQGVTELRRNLPMNPVGDWLNRKYRNMYSKPVHFEEKRF